LLETLEVVERMTGATPDELVQLRRHELPPGTDYLWEWFIRLSNTRTPGFGVAPISEHELYSFFRNRNIVPTRWELDLLVRMDKTMRDATADDKPRPEPDIVEEE
jgi:hypothetical protein